MKLTEQSDLFFFMWSCITSASELYSQMRNNTSTKSKTLKLTLNTDARLLFTNV